MKRLFGTLAAGAVFLSACDTAPIADAPLETTAAPVSPLASLAGPDLASVQTEGGTYLALTRGSSLARLTAAVEAKGGEVTFSHAGVGFAVIEGITEATASELTASRLVTDIQEDFVIPMEVPEAGTPEAAQIASPGNPAEASLYARQWNMRAIGADKAWAAGRTGSSDVTVAILDTGIDYEYPDLQGRVDLSRSISFIPMDDLYTAFYFPSKHPVTDLGFHGTHVAATVASNGFVAAGVTSQTTLMGVKVCGVIQGGCPGSAVFSGLLHAADNGADVINMSLGGRFDKSDLAQAGFGSYVGYLNRLFNYVRRQGVTVVVSAGNDAFDLDHDGDGYKTYCDTPGVVCVSATGPTARASVNGPWQNVDAPAVYTNYGRSAITVAAPGGNSGAGVAAACSQTSLTIPICQTGNYFITISGTSMAAPHVSGLAALLVEDLGKSPSRVANQLMRSADDLGPRGTDPYYGKGRINVARALGLGA